ncbi:MAG: Mini-ribonuclease 3 [Candidatus Izemoplasmataceae bacterium]
MQHNGQTLAYIGDAVYELFIREALINKGHVKPDDLHKAAIRYTGAEGQKNALEIIEPMLDENERAIVRRGRNASTARRAKNATLTTYRLATGFEALIGYLYLSGKTGRMRELLEALKVE